VAHVCTETLASLDEQLCSVIINLATNEMTMNKEVDDEWQSGRLHQVFSTNVLVYIAGASQVLVTLGNRFCTTVMDSLLQKFQPGTMPHIYLLKTLGALSVQNGMFMFVAILEIIVTF
jgi:hypothetical protein